MLVRPDNRAVYHHVFIVVICCQKHENPFDNTTFAPAAQTAMHVFPVPETGWEITLGNTLAIAIQHRFHEQSVTRFLKGLE